MHADFDHPGPPDDPPLRARPVVVPLARPVDELVRAASAHDAPAALPLHPMTLAPIGAGRAALHLVVVLCFGLAPLFVGSLLFDPRQYSEEAVPAILLIASNVLSLLLVILTWVMVKDGGGSAASLGISMQKLPANLVVGALVTVGTFAVFVLSTIVIALVWPEGFRQISANPENVRQMVPRWSRPGLLGAMILVAISEEALFRGVVLTHLRCILRSWPAAVVLGSALFAAMHVFGQQPAAVVALFPVAVFWSIVAIWRRSLIPTIVGHALFNWLMLLYMQAFEPPAA